MVEKSVLSRSLAHLLGNIDENEPNFVLDEKSDTQQIIETSIENLYPNPEQPRRHFREEALEELSQSILRNGILQPILVRPHPFKSEAYEIVAGERRWQAAQKVGLLSVPTIVKNLNDANTIEIALIENIHRQDLNSLEEAAGYKQLIEEFDYSQEKLAEILSRSRSHIANLIRLLSLPKTVKELLIQGEISTGHARTLVGLPNAEAAANFIVLNALTVREAEKLAKNLQNNPSQSLDEAYCSTPKSEKKSLKKKNSPDANIRALETQLSEKLGLKIVIKPGKKRRSGSINIHYTDLEDFDRIRQILEQMSS